MSDQPAEGIAIAVSTPELIDEKTAVTVLEKDEAQINELGKNDRDSADAVIVTGADVAAHLLPMRDDFDPTLTFRAVILGSGLAAFLAVMTQIYTASGPAHHFTLHCHRTANNCIPSSNQPKSAFQAFSSFLFPTLLVTPGPNFSPAVISLRRDGENDMGRADYLGGLRSSSL